MTPDDIATRATARLRTEVGAFFCNTRRGVPGICAICTGPATDELCPQCRDHRAAFGTGVADLIVPLAYAKGRMSPRHQSEHHVYQYKRPRLPARKCVTDLSLMVLVGSLLHGACIARTVGWWSAVTFVPSATRPGHEHPVSQLARQIPTFALEVKRVLLDPGPGLGDSGRAPQPDRFIVAPEFVPAISGQHVLVVDDTWVSGGKAQSASLALKKAGAAAVTVFCVARWLRYDWPDHKQLIDDLQEPYNAMVCPVTGGTCPM